MGSYKRTGGAPQGSWHREELRQITKSLCPIFHNIPSSTFLPPPVTGVRRPLAGVSPKVAPLSSSHPHGYFHPCWDEPTPTASVDSQGP